MDTMEATNETAGGAGSTSETSTGHSPTAVPSQPVAQPNAAAPAAAAPSFRPVPPQAAMLAQHRAASAPSATAQPERHGAHPAARVQSKRVLTVGPDIQMKGEITTCDRVVIEGMVDATMRDVHTVELAETGSLKGTAEVEDAEISGNFEGDLAVRGKLTIYTSGRVRGNVTYGEIEIQRGGQISGNIRNAAEAKLPANHNQPGQGPSHKPKAAA
ncbi:MAG: polymer-forming cytoskeletal protein [Alphaproteobacteria bacterium]